MTKSKVTLNNEQRLYGIHFDSGYSCYGFDVVAGRVARMELELCLEPNKFEVGSMAMYRYHKKLEATCHKRFKDHGVTSCIDLNVQMLPYLGKFVEVTQYGETRRFKVGKSAGWIPCLLEIEAGENGGGAITYGSKYDSIKVI